MRNTLNCREDPAEEISFIDSEALLKPLSFGKSPKEREYLFAQEKKAIFIERIGGVLSDGKPHDLRAPDYDDWSLNGDIIVYYPTLDIALELSSMGIRVDRGFLSRPTGKMTHHRGPGGALPFQKAVLSANELPYTIGGRHRPVPPLHVLPQERPTLAKSSAAYGAKRWSMPVLQ
jgi:aspartate--ammonia ligase